MKKLIFLVFIISLPSVFADYKCNHSVNPKKVVVFVNTNFSLGEQDHAAQAACERGEAFKSIPDESITKMYMTKTHQLDEKWNNYFHDCNKNFNSPSCTDRFQKLNAENKTLDNEKEKAGATPTNLDKEITKLANQNIAVTSMVISGHDGGGRIHGEIGHLDKYNVIDVMKGVYKTKPQLLNQFNSVFMWGCWTMGPSEVSVWRDNLPSLKMCSGFYDMGPLNTTAASQTVLHDLLVKEKAITTTADEVKMKRLIQGVQNINQTYAAVYAEAQCNKNMYFYNTQGVRGSEDPKDRAGNHFLNFDKSYDCKTMEADIEKNRVALMKYYNGTLPIPTNTTTSPLREIYAYLRSHSNCLAGKSNILNGDRVLMMVFQKAVNENFQKVFSNLITKANKDFSDFARLAKEGRFTGPGSQKLISYINQNKNKYFTENYKEKSRQDIISMIGFIDGLKKQESLTGNSKIKGMVENLRHLQNAMETYMYNLNPNCMNALEWHEVRPGHNPETYCAY